MPINIYRQLSHSALWHAILLHMALMLTLLSTNWLYR